VGFLIALISMVIVFALLLPLLGVLYLDVLEAKYEVKAQVEKLEKLRREVEAKHREGS
jgi:cell division protein FtsB